MTSTPNDVFNRAQQGDVESQYILGNGLLYGVDGFTHDPKAAHKWLNIAAEKNHPKAQRLYGLCFINTGEPGHIPIVDNVNEAAYWLKRAGQSGDLQALRIMVGLYGGYGLSPDTAYAGVYDCYCMMVNICGDPEAGVELGDIYCGTSEHIKRFPGLKSYKDFKRGIRLMEDAVAYAESMENNPLKYEHYSSIVAALFTVSGCEKGADFENTNYFKEGEWIVSISKELSYSIKALEALERGAYTRYEKDKIPFLIQNDKKLIESIKKRLLHAISSHNAVSQDDDGLKVFKLALQVQIIALEDYKKDARGDAYDRVNGMMEEAKDQLKSVEAIYKSCPEHKKHELLHSVREATASIKKAHGHAKDKNSYEESLNALMKHGY